jgi:hypothetical protein
MDVLNIIGWSFVAAATAWGVTLFWARLAMAHSRALMHEDIRYWHAEAIRARELAAQLKHEIATWSRGCRQGHEDVIAIMPLLIAAQERLSASGHAEMSLTDVTETDVTQM